MGKAQQQITDLEKTVSIYKNRLRDLSQKLAKTDLDTYLFKQGIKDILEVPQQTTNGDAGGVQTKTSSSSNSFTNGTNGISINDDKTLLIDTNSNSSSKSSAFLPAVPPRSTMSNQMLSKTNNHQKMEELLLNSDSDSDFDPRAEESNTDGNSTSSGGKNVTNDLFGFEPSTSFGQQLFYNNNDNKYQNNNNNNNNNTANISNSSILSNYSNNSFSELTITPPLCKY